MSDSKTSYGIAQAAWSAETPLSQLRTGNLMVAVSEESSAQIYGMTVQVLVDDVAPSGGGGSGIQGLLLQGDRLRGGWTSTQGNALLTHRRRKK